MPSKPFTTARVLRVASIGGLVIGLCIAAAVFLSTTGSDSSSQTDDLPRLDQSRREQAEVERLGGKATVVTIEFRQWLGTLWEGRRLAYTITVMTLVCARLGWHVADLLEEDDHS